MADQKELSKADSQALLDILKHRFEKNMHRHPSMLWDEIAAKLITQPEKIASLNEMEQTGGEPDVVDYDQTTDEYIFYDCSPETPKARRSICYDSEALAARKEYKPANSAIEMATLMGIEILDETEYRYLQTLGNFDTKTSSWIKTPAMIRELGGALFGDFRYNTTFIYHNGAASYYAVRGFRGLLKV